MRHLRVEVLPVELELLLAGTTMLYAVAPDVTVVVSIASPRGDAKDDRPHPVDNPAKRHPVVTHKPVDNSGRVLPKRHQGPPQSVTPG